MIMDNNGVKDWNVLDEYNVVINKSIKRRLIRVGSYVLKGITTALFVTVLTLFAGILWSALELGGPSISQLLDIGLLASCLIGGYRTAKESKLWFMGGAAGAGYVIVGTLLLALFLPIRGVGFIQVLIEGTLIGLVAGVFGAGKKSVVSQSHFTPSYVGFDKNERDSGAFEWDTEEFVPKTNAARQNWLESSEDEFEESREIKRDMAENDVVEWPWDRKTKNKIITREPKQVQNDLVAWDKQEEPPKPWWEE
ncbi:hypothetical protein DesyoDRAFT_4965 [Desulfosporosinus youngiae DSM 17734]|uniref:Uncharacterized protein n=1 Tax=Desulfosporosinus youngiae DSM 17734 TaxID=768710 RepID=H5XZZ6_9FIRM|nr:hypothetical protein DesyoDRAFT_4965 [Desulfosporosinus youngiae DSM 17734]